MSEIKKRNSKGFVIGALLIAGMLVGVQLFRGYAQDPDTGDYPSAGHIAAIQLNNDGGRAVIFDASGKQVDAPKAAKGTWDDRGVSWSADGKRVFISSNRELDSYNIYRWNPPKNEVQRRSIGSRSQSVPWFWPLAPVDSKAGLIQSGGVIQELDVATGDTVLILPPSGERVEGTEEGSKGAMEAYDRFGYSFVTARFGTTKEQIFGLMRNDEGYTLIFQPIGVNEMGQPLQPAEMFRGSRVDLETDNNGTAAVLVSGFKFPPNAEIPKEYMKDGKVVPPFGDGVFRVTLDASNAPNSEPVILIPVEAGEALGDIAVSPDGTRLAVVIGQKLKEGGFQPMGLISMPFELNGGQQAAPIVQGAISSPSWSPDGTKITYLKQEGSDIDVYRANADGSGETKLSKGGKWSMPQFSPAK